MSSADVRDMLDLPSSGHPRPAKKHKTVEKRPGRGYTYSIQERHANILTEGINRELYALLGERAPPVAITEHIRLKEKPKWSHKVIQPWYVQSVVNNIN